MIEINIKLEEEARVLEAFGVGSSNQVRARLIDYLNTIVNDYEQNIEVSKAVAAYTFVPLIEIVDEPIEEPPVEEPPTEDPIEDPDEDPIEDPIEDPPVEEPVEDPEDPPVEDPEDPPVEDPDEPIE